jgi:hypothetical protein
MNFLEKYVIMSKVNLNDYLGVKNNEHDTKRLAGFLTG